MFCGLLVLVTCFCFGLWVLRIFCSLGCFLGLLLGSGEVCFVIFGAGVVLLLVVVVLLCGLGFCRFYFTLCRFTICC